jgi:hypothetical protein
MPPQSLYTYGNDVELRGPKTEKLMVLVCDGWRTEGRWMDVRSRRQIVGAPLLRMPIHVTRVLLMESRLARCAPDELKRGVVPI